MSTNGDATADRASGGTGTDSLTRDAIDTADPDVENVTTV
jgi:hypothetical protein